MAKHRGQRNRRLEKAFRDSEHRRIKKVQKRHIQINSEDFSAHDKPLAKTVIPEPPTTSTKQELMDKKRVLENKRVGKYIDHRFWLDRDCM